MLDVGNPVTSRTSRMRRNRFVISNLRPTHPIVGVWNCTALNRRVVEKIGGYLILQLFLVGKAALGLQLIPGGVRECFEVLFVVPPMTLPRFPQPLTYHFYTGVTIT